MFPIRNVAVLSTNIKPRVSRRHSTLCLPTPPESLYLHGERREGERVSSPSALWLLRFIGVWHTRDNPTDKTYGPGCAFVCTPTSAPAGPCPYPGWVGITVGGFERRRGASAGRGARRKRATSGIRDETGGERWHARAPNTCYEWDSNPRGRNHTNLSRAP